MTNELEIGLVHGPCSSFTTLPSCNYVLSQVAQDPWRSRLIMDRVVSVGHMITTPVATKRKRSENCCTIWGGSQDRFICGEPTTWKGVIHCTAMCLSLTICTSAQSHLEAMEVITKLVFRSLWSRITEVVRLLSGVYRHNMTSSY